MTVKPNTRQDRPELNQKKTQDPEKSILALSAQSFRGERLTAHELVRRTLRSAILSGDLRSGTRLVQADVAELLDVSTTPVREAMRDLTSEGLIHFDAHRGALVKGLSREELVEIYEMRRAIEPIAVRRAIPFLTDDLLDALRLLHEKMAAEPESPEWIDTNLRFHLMVYEASDAKRMAGVIRGLAEASVLYVGVRLNDPRQRDQAIKEHGEILRALTERDAERAIEWILRHQLSTIESFNE